MSPYAMYTGPQNWSQREKSLLTGTGGHGRRQQVQPLLAIGGVEFFGGTAIGVGVVFLFQKPQKHGLQSWQMLLALFAAPDQHLPHLCETRGRSVGSVLGSCQECQKFVSIGAIGAIGGIGVNSGIITTTTVTTSHHSHHHQQHPLDLPMIPRPPTQTVPVSTCPQPW